MLTHWFRTGRINPRGIRTGSIVSVLSRPGEITCGLLLILTLPGISVAPIPAESRSIGAALLKRREAAWNQTDSDRQRASQMLDPLFEATRQLNPDLTKIYLQTRIADALWDYDEPRARSRFESALKTCELLKSDVASVDSRPQYRGDVLEAIKRHDPNWAKKLALDYWHGTKKQNPDMWTLRLLIDVDTELAIQILRREIDTNTTGWLEAELTKLRAKDPVQADELFVYALSAAARKPKRSVDRFRELFNYVFPSKTDNYLGFVIDVDTSPVTPELIARFIDFGCEALIREADQIEQESGKDGSVGERSGMGYVEVQLWLRFFERYAPDCATKIRNGWDEALLSLQGGKEHIRETKLMFGPMTKEFALRNAREAKDQLDKMAYYSRAITVAADQGDFDQALAILKTNFEVKMSSDFEARILVRAAKNAIANDDADAAYRYTSKVRDLRQRTELSCGIARMMSKRKDSSRAVRVINEALEYAQKAKDDRERAQAMLQIADAATLLESARGFEVVNQAIEELNHAKSSVSLFDFDNNLLLLARVNFDHALSLAAKLNENESRLIARVAICRGVLSKQ